MPEARLITTADPLYPLECALRESVLLNPIGYDIERFKTEYPEAEARALHFVAATQTPGGDRVLACAMLLPPGVQGEPGKLMQMAVDPQRQNEGLGRRILTSVESHAFGVLKLDSLYCHAQVRALGFYEKLGWSVEGEQFLEAGIWHRKMTLAAPRVTAPTIASQDW